MPTEVTCGRVFFVVEVKVQPLRPLALDGFVERRPLVEDRRGQVAQSGWIRLLVGEVWIRNFVTSAAALADRFSAANVLATEPMEAAARNDKVTSCAVQRYAQWNAPR